MSIAEEDNNAATKETTTVAPSRQEPLIVIYCGECTLPLEYCSHGGRSEKCKAWFDKHAAELVAGGMQIVNDTGDDDSTAPKKHQKRGGKGMPKTTKVCCFVERSFARISLISGSQSFTDYASTSATRQEQVGDSRQRHLNVLNRTQSGRQVFCRSLRVRLLGDGGR